MVTDFETQAMLHAAKIFPNQKGVAKLSWSTENNLARYLIQVDETHGSSHQMTKCYLDIAHQNLIGNPETFSAQDCSKGKVTACNVAGEQVPLWVLRAAKVQNSGSAPSDCTPSLACFGTANNPNYSGTAGRDYMHYYQQLHPILPVASNKS